MATGGPPTDARSRIVAAPSHDSSGAASSAAPAGTQATGSEVVGRRTPAGLTVSPAIALSRLDLPTPVPPASASTYRSPG